MISLDVQHLCKSFGTNRVLKDITFRHEGGILGIAGPNGSGKSTLLKCVTGLLRPTSGKVTWREGERPIDTGALKQLTGYAAPYISLYRELTVAENISFLSRLRKMTVDDDWIEELLARVDLHHIREKPYQNLSTGQQQRARLATALFMDPEVLVLDEPGSNLDERGRQVVHDLVKGAKSRGKTILLASNNDSELELCDRVYSVDKGYLADPTPR